MADQRSRLVIEKKRGWLTLRGRIDESAHLHDTASNGIDTAHLDIDLAGVTFINSLGVRDWARLLRALDARGVVTRLHRCSEPMVQQMNMITDARANAQILSFQAPFACDACGWEGAGELTPEEVTPLIEQDRAPSMPCPECGSAARFNEIVDRYFLFLR